MQTTYMRECLQFFEEYSQDEILELLESLDNQKMDELLHDLMQLRLENEVKKEFENKEQ